jgi:uncharacterized protein (DUF1697 family)
MGGTYVALLFSIGIGEGKRLVMAEWREVMEGMGLRNVRTWIATGNAVFESEGMEARELEERLERAFERRFGRRVDTIVREGKAFRRMVRGNPFLKACEKDGSRVVVRVMREGLERGAVAGLEKYLTRGERVEVVGGDLWVHFGGALNESSLVRVLGSKRLGVGTVRNWNTIKRLGEMVEEGEMI